MPQRTNAQSGPAPVRISIEEALEIAKRHELQGELPKARALYAQILRSFPENAEAKAKLSAILRRSDMPAERLSPLYALAEAKNHAELAGRVTELLREYPGSFVLWTLLGSAHYGLAQYERAESCARRAVSLRPQFAPAVFNLANVLQAREKMGEALAACDEALRLDPKLAVAHHHRALLLLKNNDIRNAVAAWDNAIKLTPDLAAAHYGQGLCFSKMAQFEKALMSFSKALDINPKFVDAQVCLANALYELGDLTKALDAFDRAIELDPGNAGIAQQKTWIQAKICDFSATGNPTLGDDLNAFEALALEDDPERQLRRSRIYWEGATRHIRPMPLPARPATRPERLKVGYFSADFHDHATLYLLSGVLREHDRSRFEIHAYSYGRHRSRHFRDLLGQPSLHFHDVESLSDASFADLARSHRLDIAIDLKGYTIASRFQVFGYRLAPIQMNFLGYPGSAGTNAFDYIVADRTVIPRLQREYYDEKILCLPHSYQPNDNSRRAAEVETSRSDFGLPGNGMVLCCFNNSYKIGVRELEIWMRVLKKVEGSVLWLLKSNEQMVANLHKAAQERGVAPDRLIFSDIIAHELHLARHKHADLFLDTFNYNAHTTASDALWSGVPVVTKAGKQFSARVAASLLNAVGLPDLITETDEEYEAKIVRLATHPNELRKIRQRLVRNRLSHPLFDTKRYTRNFEAGLQRAYDRYFAGEAPADIMVSDAGRK